MVADQTIRQLRLAHFLRGVDDATLLRLAQDLELITLDPGERLIQLGQPVQDLYVLLDGDIDLLVPTEETGVRRIGQLSAGSVVGAWELLFGLNAQHVAQAVAPVRALVWPRAKLFPFLEDHPGALASLRLAAHTRRMAGQVEFRWLSEDETVYALARKHLYRLAIGLIVPVTLAAAGSLLTWWALGSPASLWRWPGPILILIGVLYGAWKWIDWRNDYYLVTDRRVAWLEKVVALYDSRREAPLHQVLSVSVSTDMMGRLLDFGDVNIRTYTGNIVFEDVGRPQAIAAVVEERWRRLQLSRHAQDRDLKEVAVKDLLEGEGGTTPAPAAELPQTSEPQPESATIGLDHWSFQLRFEERGVITYRKHWAVLVHSIALPSVAVLLLVALITLNLTGQLTLGDAFVSLVATLAALGAACAWWVYQFADWANDIYQVSPSHVIDVYKRPLGRELRRVAPLENLLSTEVDQRGLVGILLNFGDVRVNIGAEQLDFEGVFNPHEVQQDIVRAQEAFLERKRQSERDQRRDEMVEWLSIYHGEMQARRSEPPTPEESDDYP